VETIGKALVLAAALVAVVTGVGAGFSWLHHHVSHETFVVWGFCLCAFMWKGVTAFSKQLGVNERIRASAGSIVFNLVIMGELLFWQNDATINYLVVGLGFGIPSVWVLYQFDKLTHKLCPECCETVKVGARICRYCRYEFAPASKPRLYVVRDHAKSQG
jgi:hypothetical protein